MGTTTLDESLLASQWAVVCQSAQSHAVLVSQMCRHAASKMIRGEAEPFCSQPVPKTQEELSNRYQQAMALTSKISSIAHADSMARMHPSVSAKILAEAKEFSDRLGLDGDISMESLALTSKISQICQGDLMRQLR